MRLFETILDANHKAVAGDASAGLRPADFEEELPIIALTCIDPRLNAFFPNILGIPAEQFIWLRNAGNIITSPLSSTMRSLALATAVKGGKEIAIIGHTDCQVAKTTVMQLLEKLKALDVDRNRLPDNLNEFFGMFATERQNVIKACDFVRSKSRLDNPEIPALRPWICCEYRRCPLREREAPLALQAQSICPLSVCVLQKCTTEVRTNAAPLGFA